MKIVCVDKDDMFIMPDTVVFGVDEPFFDPDFGGDTEKVAGVAIKITRMVKCIDAKFASRVWQEAARCVDYRIKGHKSITIGRSFDRSFQLTCHWMPKADIDAAMIEKFDAAIENITKFVTLRVGDYIFVSND